MGFYGFLSSKRIGNRYLWVSLFVAATLFNFVFPVSFGLMENGFDFLNLPDDAWNLLMMAVILVPAYVALFRYSFQSEPIWS